jgi:hypothetical protein
MFTCLCRRTQRLTNSWRLFFAAADAEMMQSLAEQQQQQQQQPPRGAYRVWDGFQPSKKVITTVLLRYRFGAHKPERMAAIEGVVSELEGIGASAKAEPIWVGSQQSRQRKYQFVLPGPNGSRTHIFSITAALQSIIEHRLPIKTVGVLGGVRLNRLNRFVAYCMSLWCPIGVGWHLSCGVG